MASKVTENRIKDRFKRFDQYLVVSQFVRVADVFNQIPVERRGV